METGKSKLKEFFIEFSDDFERPDPEFETRSSFEGKISFYFLILYALWRVLLFDFNFLLIENIINAILDTLSFAPVLLIATKPVDSWFKRTIKKTYGLDIILFVIGFYSLYFVAGILLQFQLTLQFVSQIENYVFEGNFWLNYVFILACIFFFFRFPFYLLEKREDAEGTFKIFKKFKQNLSLWLHFIVVCILGIFTIYALTKSSMGLDGLYFGLLAIPLFLFILILSQIPKLKYNVNREHELGKIFTFSDLFSMLFMAPAILFVTLLPFSSSWAVFFFLIIMFYGTENQREHFYYSFAPESSKDVFDYVNMILISFLIFIPLGILVQFIDLNDFTVNLTFTDLYSAFCIWAFYVGIGEEVIFRCGILILFSDLFKVKEIKRHKTWALLISSLIFGFGHVTKGWNYCFLAIIAGFAYGILFLKGRNMFGPMMLHMTVDVVAAKFFRAQL